MQRMSTKIKIESEEQAPTLPSDPLSKFKAFYNGTWEGTSRRLEVTTGALIDSSRVKTMVGFTEDGRFSRVLLRHFPDGRIERSYHSGTVRVVDDMLEVDVADFWWITSFQTDRVVSTQVLPKDKSKQILMHSMLTLEHPRGQTIKTVVRHLRVGTKVTLEFLHEQLIDPRDVYIERDPEEVEREMRRRRDLGLAEGESMDQVTDPSSGQLDATANGTEN
eukprot:comp17019_c0_seq1/m.15706 comp17019_c0_seq1/g.15706  ORF comp17019_c0_seq1/g.15706 comp17019_c0_seq1/m.15706 type:complete len:220 (-) comp17019_c0_seq1:79-738(-)